MLTFHKAAQILEGHAGNAVLSNCHARHKGLHRMSQVGCHESTCSIYGVDVIAAARTAH